MFKFLLIVYRETLLKIVNHINYYNNFNYCTWIRAILLKKLLLLLLSFFSSFDYSYIY